MQLLRPSSSVCYKLKLPQVDTITSNTSINDVDKRLLTLNYRTGAATHLSRSNVFVHGGIIIPLNLSDITTKSIQEELMLYFAKQINSSSSSSTTTNTINNTNTNSTFGYSLDDPILSTNFDTLYDWISPNLFILDLITRKWSHFDTFYPKDSNALKRLFHSIVLHDDKLYLFGGLIVSPTNGYELIASNELWELDLTTRNWKLHDINPDLTRRYNHSMMVHVDSTDTPRLIIVGGKDNLDHNIVLIDIFNISTSVWESLDCYKSKGQRIMTNINGVPNGITKSNNVPVLIDKDIVCQNNPNETSLNGNPYTNTNVNTNTSNSNGGNNTGIDQNNKNVIASTLATLKNNDNSTQNDCSSDQNIVSDIPIIVYYNRNESNNNSICDQMPNEGEIPSPIVALSLLPNSQGLRMNSFQDKETLKIPLNLKNLSISSYKKGLILTGFYPTTNSSDFHCYLYDLSCAFWTKVAIDCPDSDINHHRFNELFVWKSHHRAIVLGTEIDDHYGPTVQRFDYLLSFRLAMMNVLKEVPRYILDHDKGEMVPLIPELDRESPILRRNKSSNTLSNNSPSNNITQFENYIKYITTPLELESTSSVFPPYALVLGKDSMEVFGQSISDFEFISSNGESTSVPMYLLRKRWGRYFDMLLARAYSQVYKKQNLQDKKKSSSQKNTINHSNITKKKSPASFNLNTRKTDSPSSHNSDGKLSPSSSIPNLLNSKYLTTDKNNSNLLNHQHATRLNNMTDIPIFRVPFQDSHQTNTHIKDTKAPKKNSTLNVIHSSKPDQRRSSSVLGSIAHLRNTAGIEFERRASHPIDFDSSLTSNVVDKINMFCTSHPSRRSSLRNLPNPQSSRRPSTMSQNTSSRASTISLVSSSSDRRGANVNSLTSRHNSTGNSSESSYNSVTYELVNVSIPSGSIPPMISLPPTPTGSVGSVSPSHLQIHNNNNNVSNLLNSIDHTRPPKTRQNSLEFYASPRHVLISSRRSSYESRLQSMKSAKSASFSETVNDQSIIEEGLFPSSRPSTFSPAVSSSPSTPSSFSVAASSHGSILSSKSFLSLNTDEFTSHNPILDQFDLDPLLIPRSLYMPWPTKTVKAFTEFFYTGKVNGQWDLAPTVLDLLIMSYLYEVPLLYDMITEVLYMLVGKKEETLKLTTKNMINGYMDMIQRFHNNEDIEGIESLLAANENYQDLLELKESLDNINNGFVDKHILEKYILNKHESRKISIVDSVLNGYSSVYQSDILSMSKRRRKTATGDSTDKEMPNIDVIYSGGPRDSQDSLGSLLYLRHKSVINPRRKKSSLSKELNFDILNSDNNTNIINKQEEYMAEQQDDLNDLSEKLKDFKIRGKSVSKEKNLDEQVLEPSLSSPCSSSSVSSDSENEGEDAYSIGSISSRKIRRELKLEEELDESIDPLLKLGNIETSNNPLKNSILNQRNLHGNRNGSITSTSSPLRLNNFDGPVQGDPKSKNSKVHGFDTIADKFEKVQDVTLENLVSTSEKSMISIVDYIIKLIYRTSVMVNDTRLMIRCMDCIEFSNILKKIKINMIKDYNKLSPVRKNTSIKVSSLSPVVSPLNMNHSLSKGIERQSSIHLLNTEEVSATLSQKVTSQNLLFEENNAEKDSKGTTTSITSGTNTTTTATTTTSSNHNRSMKDFPEDKRETSLPLPSMSLTGSLTFPFFGKKRS